MQASEGTKMDADAHHRQLSDVLIEGLIPRDNHYLIEGAIEAISAPVHI